MNSERQRYIEGSLEEAVREFFGDYELGAASQGLPDAQAGTPVELQLGSLVGFRGSSVRGGLAFVAPAALVAQLLPVPRAESRAELQLRDWSAEIANQLVGRFKNKLSARALDFDVGTAVCFRGTSMSVTFPPQTPDTSVSLTTSWAGASVYLDCAFVDGVAVPDGPTLRIVPEGDVLLF
ncbi:MAG TPA: chemotaxis protein CheX [Labilithrix sp.]|nr:chemotaxis protein CheX [Labilithrix sp.]